MGYMSTWVNLAFQLHSQDSPSKKLWMKHFQEDIKRKQPKILKESEL